MNQPDGRDREIQALRDRLTRMCQACHRINESLDLDTVLQEVLDSARSLTGTRYGVMVLLDGSEGIQDSWAPVSPPTRPGGSGSCRRVLSSSSTSAPSPAR